MYYLLRRLLFLFDAEAVHHFSMNCFKALSSIFFLKKILASNYKPVSTRNLQSEIYSRYLSGLKFSNPIGLAAGFDKNAVYLCELETMGFGFVEIGTVTPLPQSGNQRPRLFRLPHDKALINRMGFNNDGVKLVAERLRRWKEKGVRSRESGVGSDSRLIIGGNIGKNKSTPNEEAWKDYEICFRELFNCVDYFVVNVSSPNTPGLRELQEKESLRKILAHLQTINKEQNRPKPLLLKIAPDLSWQHLDDIIDLAMEIKLDGLVATNTTTSREHLTTSPKRLNKIGAGGLSGVPLRERSTQVVKYIHQKTNGEIPIIASGGVFTGRDAREKLEAGASLVQIWTGFIYEGPGIVKKICQNLS